MTRVRQLAIARARSRQWEVQSTEEVLRKIRETNSTLSQEKILDLMVGSMDVEALYPSIDQMMGPQMVAQEILETDVEFEGINYDLAARFLMATMDQERLAKEGLLRLMPRSKAGNKER